MYTITSTKHIISSNFIVSISIFTYAVCCPNISVVISENLFVHSQSSVLVTFLLQFTKEAHV